MAEQHGKYVVVVGGANLDIGGKALSKLILKDSNPGHVRLDFGGVGKNIAHNLSSLGAKVYMLTAFGGDLFSRMIESDCIHAGIDVKYAKRVRGAQSSIYLYVEEPDGEMALALCSSDIMEKIDADYLERHLSLLNRASAVVLDCNLTQTAIEYLTSHCAAPIFADPVSVSKAEKLRNVLPCLHTIKPNILEAERLLAREIRNSEQAMEAAEEFLELGVKNVFISMGGDGMCCASKEDGVFLSPCAASKLNNVTGGGDAVTAMLVKAHNENMNLRKAAEYAMAAGALAVESPYAVSRHMSMDNIEKRICRGVKR